jgi:hypothetical protein
MASPLSIGIEIEIENSIFFRDFLEETNLFQEVDEHCGRELRSKPAVGPFQIRRLFNGISELEEINSNPGFQNTGTHLHIDFLDRANNLKRRQAPIVDGVWNNPLKNGKRYYWVDSEGNNWDAPSSAAVNAAKIAKVTPASTLLAVKRFLALGIRFADVLLAIQHPDRRFNKYCHTLAYWDEKKLMDCKSIDEIVRHPNLAQNHRRHAINVLSFPKHGTMEIRIMRGTLDTKEIWAQTFLFCRMAALAKRLNLPIPACEKARNKTEIGAGLVVLLNACGIHGKMRRYIIELSKKRLENPSLNCFCYNCHEQFMHSQVKDIGLSRSVCDECFQHNHKRCVLCGHIGAVKLDNKIDGGRWLCNVHSEASHAVATAEKAGNAILTSDGQVGSGFDENGISNLERIRKLFATKRKARVVRTIKI